MVDIFELFDHETNSDKKHSVRNGCAQEAHEVRSPCGPHELLEHLHLCGIGIFSMKFIFKNWFQWKIWL